MTDDLLFEHKHLTNKVRVYSDRVEVRELGKKKTILLNQISSVEMGSMFSPKLKIETSGGKIYTVSVPSMSVTQKKKQELHDVIMKAKAAL